MYLQWSSETTFVAKSFDCINKFRCEFLNNILLNLKTKALIALPFNLPTNTYEQETSVDMSLSFWWEETVQTVGGCASVP